MKNTGKKPRALILQAAGVNCDRETAYALTMAGAAAERVHINDIIESPKRLDAYEILALPGGFSFGDDIASGQVLARKLKYRLREPLDRFIAADKLVIGICNGFQVLVKLGLLPALDDRYHEQQVALTHNLSGKFEDRWVYLRPDPDSRAIITRDVDRVLYLPVRHGEGRLVCEPQVLDRLRAAGQIAVRYTDADGRPGGYPINPNGSIDNVAGICDPSGRVFGLMPHPEVFVRLSQHPRWTRSEQTSPDGSALFANAVRYFL